MSEAPREARNLPAGTLEGRPVAWLLRHADRAPLPEGAPGDDVGLTEEGAARARALGIAVRGRLCGLRTSPVRRCRETAALIREGAESDLALNDDPLLGAPGVFVEDAGQAWAAWLRHGNDGVMEHLMGASEPLAGLAEPAAAARRLLEHLLSTLQGEPGLHVHVTHDSVLAPAVARWLGRPLERALWPGFLDGAFIWSDAGRPMLCYGGMVEALR